MSFKISIVVILTLFDFLLLDTWENMAFVSVLAICFKKLWTRFSDGSNQSYPPDAGPSASFSGDGNRGFSTRRGSNRIWKWEEIQVSQFHKIFKSIEGFFDRR